MTREIRKKKLQAKIVLRLKELYNISDEDLESGSLIYQNALVLPEEIAEAFFRQFGVVPTKSEFGSWSDFVNHLVDKLLHKQS